MGGCIAVKQSVGSRERAQEREATEL